MDNIKQVVKDIRFLIATDCCNETIQKRIENFIDEREQDLRIHDVSESDHWNCEKCGKVPNNQVTYQETHQGCGASCH